MRPEPVTTLPPSLRDAGRYNTLIVGAGLVGLAVGACLKRAGIPCFILEQSRELGASWHRHYDRLHLHTDKAHSALPFFPFPKAYPRYPSRLQVIDYLERYARHFQLEPSFAQQVRAARQVDGVWEVQTQDAHYQALNLVVASGYNREPYLPSWPGQASFQGTLQHSSHYRNAQPFENQRVLVVGFGNSGGEIALDLWEHGAKPSLAVRGPVNVIPRELFGIPIVAISLAQRKLPPRWADALSAAILRATIGDLTRYGLRPLPVGPLAQIKYGARVPLIDVGTVRLLRRGQVSVYPGIERFTETGVLFTDGKRQNFDAVILATGYRPQVNAFLKGASAVHDEQGTPLSSGGETPLSGLYFCGYQVAATGMLREIALEARRVAAAIAQKRTAPKRTASNSPA